MKKFLSYILTFALLFFISAAATVSMASNAGGGLINPGINNSQQASSSSLFNGILDTFGKQKKFNLKGTLDLKYEDTEIPVSLFVDIDITDSDNIKVNGYLNVKYNSYKNVIKFSYYNNTIYLSYNDNNVKLATQTIYELVDELSGLITNENEKASSSNENTSSDTASSETTQETDLLESLMPMLMDSLNNMVETTLENGDKRSEIVFGELLKAVVTTDSENLLKNIEFETSNFNGYSLQADLNITFDDEIVIYNPETKSEDLKYFDLAEYKKLVSNLLTLRKFKSSVSLDINNKNVSFDLTANLLNKDFLFNLKNNDFGLINDLNVAYVDNNLYLNTNNVNLLFNNKVVDSAYSYVSSLVNLEDMNIESLTNKVDINSLMNIDEINLNTILNLLSSVRNIQVNENQFVIKVDTQVFGLSFGEIELIIDYFDNKLNQITVNGLVIEGNKIDLFIQIQELKNDIQVNNSEKYLDVYNFIESSKNLLSSNNLNLNVDFDLYDANLKYQLGANLEINKALKDNQLLINLLSTLDYSGCELYLDAIYQNNTSFVNFNGTKLMLETDRISETVTRILTIANQDPELLNSLINKISGLSNSENITTLTKELFAKHDNFNFNISTQDVLNVAYLLLNNVEISGTSINVQFDGEVLGYSGIIDMEITLNNHMVESVTISKLKVNNNYIDVVFTVNTLDKDLETISNEEQEKYINVAEFVKVVEASYNTIKTKSITGTLTVGFNYNNQRFDLYINYGFKLDENNNIVIYLWTDILGKSIKLYVSNNTIYLDVQGLKTKVQIEQIPELFDWLNKEFNLEINANKIDTNEIENKINDIRYILGVVSNLDVSTVLDKVVFNEKSMEVIIDENNTIFVNYNNVLQQIIVNNDNNVIEVNIDIGLFDLNNIDFDSFAPYESLIDIYNSVTNSINTESNYLFNFDLKVNNEEISALVHLDKANNIQITLTNNSLGVINNLIISYLDGNIYLNVNDVYVLVSDELISEMPSYLAEVVKMFELEGVIQEIHNFITIQKTNFSNFNPLVLIDYLDNITLTSTGVTVIINSQELNLGNEITVSLTHNKVRITNVSISGLEFEDNKLSLSVNVSELNEDVSVQDSQKYYDIVGLADNISYLINSNQGKINLDVNADVYDENYILDLDCEGSLQNNYLDLTASLSGGYNLFANLTMINGELYAQINNMFVKADIETVIGLIISNGVNEKVFDLKAIEELGSNLNIKNFINDFDLSYLSAIKNIKANNEFVEIIIDKSVMGGTEDLVIKVTLNNNLPTNVTINNLFINSNIQINTLSLTFEEKEIKEKEFNKNNYLDLEDAINKVSKLPYLEDLNAVLDIDLYTLKNKEYNYEVGFELDYKKHIDNEGELWSIIFSIIGEENAANMSATYQSQMIFAEYNGLKLMLETDKIANIVNTILSILNIENDYNDIIARVVTLLEGKGIMSAVSGLTLPSVNLSNNEIMSLGLFAFENLNLSSNQLSIKIDGKIFGYDGEINLTIDFIDNNISKVTISKLKINQIYVDLSIDLILESQTIETIPENEHEYYINVDKLTEAIEAGYKTITQEYVTGNVTLSTVLFGEAVDLTIYYGIGNNNGTFEIYIETNYKGLDIKLIYQNGAIFVDIQGMRVQIELNNINNLVHWIESEFGIEINEQEIQDKVDEIKSSLPKTLEDVIKQMANIDLSFINKIEFSENIIKSFVSLTNNKTMVVLLKNGMTLRFGYSDKIENVVFESEDIEVLAKVDDAPIYTENYNPEIDTTTYSSYTDLTELITLLKQTVLGHHNFSFDVLLSLNSETIRFNTLINMLNFETSVHLNENTFGYIKNLDFVYVNNQVYLKINDLYVLLSEELLNDSPDLIDELLIRLGYNTKVDDIINSIKEKLNNTKELNVFDYLKYIETIDITAHEFRIKVNANIFALGDYSIEIRIVHNKEQIENIYISGLELNGNSLDVGFVVRHAYDEVEINNPEQYIDIYKVAKENIEFFKTGELDLDVEFKIDSDVDLTANGNIKLDLNNKEFSLILNITGDYNFTLAVNYYNETAYIEINGIKVKSTLDKVQELLSELGLNINIENEIDSLLNCTPKLNITFDKIWNAIEKLILTSSKLELNFNFGVLNIDTLLDFVINIENNLVREIILSNLDIVGYIINADVFINGNNIERNVVSENEYLDLTEAVINAKNLINKDIINLLADVKLYDNKLNEEIGLTLDLSKIFENGNLSASALINLLYNNKEFNIDTIYKNNTWLANLNGLKLMLEKDRIEETVQTILSIIGKDIHSYDEIVNKVVSLLEGESLYNILSDVKVVSADSNELDYETVIKELLKGVEISSTEIKLNIDGNVFGFDSLIKVIIKLENNDIKTISIDKLKLGDKFIDVLLNISEERKEVENISNEKRESYVNLAEFAKVAKATLKTFESKTISGFFTLGFTFAGERNLLNVNYGISFDKEKGYEGYIQTNFKGLDVNVYFIENKIYLDIVGLKIYLTFEDINGFVQWLNKFGVEIDFDFTLIEDVINGEIELLQITDIYSILDMIFSLDMSFVEKAIFNENSLDVYFKGGLNIFVNYLDVVNQVIFQKGDIYVELNCTDFNEFALNINKEEFHSYTIVTDMVDSALELLKKKQVSMNAETLIYENNLLADRVDIALAINTQDTLNMYAGVVVNNDNNTNIHFAYQDDYIFANYENLMLSLSQKSLKEILVIVLEALGVDAKTIGFLGDVAEDMNLNTDNLQEIIPSLDFGNPLNMLKLIKSIDIVDGEFIITIDGKAFTGTDKSEDMTVKVKAENGDISTIKLGNVYSNGESQRFDLNINFTEYTGVKQILDKSSYIDISGSAGILKAFVNTSYLKDYSMSGIITVTAEVIGIPINMDIPVEARVKIVDGETVAYVAMDVPVIGSNVPGFTGINVNNDVPYEFGDTSIKSRRLEIMYKDEYIYFYRKDVVNQTVFATRTYEKTLKLNASEMTADLVNYLLSYGLGFSDTIMAEIDKAIIKATDRSENPLDVSNILKGFSHSEGTDLYSILVNLAEIANNDLLGDALINIYTVNNEATNYKDYIGRLAFDINMPLASVCEINLKTDNLTLNNIGQTVDVSNVDSYANNYQFKENQQYEKSGGNWEFAGEKQYTIKFVDSMGNTPSDITAPVDNSISLPSLSTIVEVKEDGEHTYTFAGWYLSQEFKPSDKVSYVTMPRGNRTLYAKWDESVRYHRNVTLNSMGGGQDLVITQLEGSRFTLPALENKIVVDGQTKITYGFTGWFTDENCTERATIFEIPNEDITLYAGWEEIDRYVAYNLKVVDNGVTVFDQYIGEGLDIELSGFTIDSYTKYYLTQDWTNEYTICEMPSNDLILYVRNRYALNIVSAYGDLYDTTEYHYQGETYNLPSQSNYVVDDGNTRVTYTFNGWDGRSDVMPNSNLRVVASWTVVTKYYYTVTFELCYNGNIGYYSSAKLFKDGIQLGKESVSVKVLEGNMDLSSYTATWVYKAVFYYHYNFQGWSTSKNGSAITSVNITGNTTIYGLWSGLKTGQ